jgi:hypothetical protein
MGTLTEIKDNIVSFSAEKFLKIPFKRYGEMLDFNINSEDKIITIKVQLKGETDPLLVKVNDYEYTEDSGSPYLIVKKISISKEWMNLAANDFIVGKKLPVPKKYLDIIKMVL